MSKKTANLIKNIAYPFAGVVFFVVLWHILALINNYELVLPTPISTFKGLIQILSLKEFYVALSHSLLRSVVSCLVSFLLALLMGLIAKMFLPFKKAISPIISGMRSLPTLAITLILLLKVKGTSMPVYVACLVVLPTAYSSIMVALNSVDKTLLDATKVYRLSKIHVGTRIYLPSIRAGLIETIASSFSLTFKVVVSAEIMASTANSVGIFMVATRVEAKTYWLFASAIAVILICILAEFLLRLPLKFKSGVFVAHKSRLFHKVK